MIDLNFYPVAYAGLTNRSYRGVGLGISGYHQDVYKRQVPQYVLKFFVDNHLNLRALDDMLGV